MTKGGHVVVYCSDLMFTSSIRPIVKERGRNLLLKKTFDPMLDFEETGIELFVIDLTLKGIEVAEMVETIKAANPDTPIIAFCPHVETELIENAQTAGADFVIPRSELLAKLGEVLG